MDDRRFDQLTRVIASASSRRSLLKGLLGLGGAASIPGVSLLETAAQGGRPQCPTGQERCKGQCVDPSLYLSDPRNCGSCGNNCGGRNSCVDGVCAPPPCQPRCQGKTCGSDGCGGSCGTCAVGQVCHNDRRCCTPKCDGKCTGEGDGCGGTCVNPDPCCGSNDPCCGNTDPCCGVPCAADEVCTDGICVTVSTSTTVPPESTTTTGQPATTTTSAPATTTTTTVGPVLCNQVLCLDVARPPCYQTYACNPATGQCEASNPFADGAICASLGGSGVCVDASCQFGSACAIDGVGYAEGAANPENACQTCQGQVSRTSWTAGSEGTICALALNTCEPSVCRSGACVVERAANGALCTGGSCLDGTCCTGCVIDGACFAPGDPNPLNLCQECNTSDVLGNGRNAWSNKFVPCLGPQGGCLTGTCDPLTGGCAYTAIGDGASCSFFNPDNSFCQTGTSGTCLGGACVATPQNEGQSCAGVNTNPCSSGKTCQGGICAENPIKEGEVCFETQQPFCREPDGVCQAGACVGNPKPDGTICAQPTDCRGRVCQNGMCSELVSIRQSEPCSRGITECLTGYVCLFGSCSESSGSKPSFCVSTLPYCQNRVVTPETCNGDGTCASDAIFESGVIICDSLDDPDDVYPRECCPGMVCSNPPNCGEICLSNKLCYYPEDLV